MRLIHNDHLKSGCMKEIQTLGIITKREKLSTAGLPSPLNELVLESIAPYPGYYEDIYAMDDKKFLHKYLYLMLKSVDYFNDDHFIRVAEKIRAQGHQKFDAVLGQLFYYNQFKPCIRLKEDDYSMLPQIIRSLAAENIEFMVSRTVEPYDSIIRIKKFIDLREVAEGVYENVSNREVSFLAIPAHLEWDAFEQITLSVKMNGRYSRFDAAAASVYYMDRILEMVRIYDWEHTLEKLKDIRREYIREIGLFYPV